MPQHRHCPPAKHYENKNPKYHNNEHEKDVLRILAAHPPKTVERELK
jgi:hypothetical protein